MTRSNSTEMNRCREMGARGVIITSWPSGNDDLSSEDDRFFAAAQDFDVRGFVHEVPQRLDVGPH